MDMSLDDYMRTKKDRIPAPAAGPGRFTGRLGGGGMRRTSSYPPPDARQYGMKNDNLKPKGSALSRLGISGSISKRNTTNVRQKFPLKGLAMDNERLPVSDPGNLKIVITDAREKLSQRRRPDARDRLTKKDSSVADTRIKQRNYDDKTNRAKTVNIGEQLPDLEEEDYDWMKTVNNPVRPMDQGFGIQCVVNQTTPEIIQHDSTNLTIVRNFRPSLATFSVDNGGTHTGFDDDDYNVRITRRVPPPEPVYTLPDYSDLLKDTQRKLDAGLGDLYYGRMQADREETAPITKVHKITSQRTNAVEAPIITFNNDKIQQRQNTKSDPTGIVALPPRRKPPVQNKPLSAPVLQSTRVPRQEEAMEVDSDAVEKISPLQGFRVIVSNLHPAVSREDIIELFACIGALKKARLVKKGCAEIIFVGKDDALSAVKRYHNRLLDNLPMNVKCVASAAQLKAASNSSMSLTSKSKEPAPPLDLDIDIVHKALFKTSKDQATSQPVQFLVKI